MLSKSIKVAGLLLQFNADRQGVGIHWSYSGGIWHWLVNILRPRPGEITVDQVTDQTSGSDNELAQSATAEQKVASYQWYHSIDFGNGVKSRGQFDHNPILSRYRLPASFQDQRVLDVAAYDGFWAFEFEKRGASEVVALDLDRPADLDWPPLRRLAASEAELSVKFGQGFALAKELLHSSVNRVVCNVYDLTPETMGMFDVVHAGDFLIHLNSPVKALQAMASVCHDYALISDVYFPELETWPDRFLAEYRGGREDVSWWRFSRETLIQMVSDAGFTHVEVLADFKYGQNGFPENMNHLVLKAFK